jgi:hypothetical protein
MIRISVATNRRPPIIAAALSSIGRLAITTAGACAVIAVATSAAFASASFADVSSSGTEGPSPLLGKEMAVFTSKGISPERARQALDVQGKIAQANLVAKVEAAMGSAYAGAWFDPAAARVHFGVTSIGSLRAAQRIVAQAGLDAVVTYTSVRSTWPALMAVQSWWNKRLVDLGQDVMMGLDAQRNAVVVTLSSSVPASERAALEREAATASVNVFVEIAPQSHLGAEPLATCKKFKTLEAYCEKTLVSGVGWSCSRKAGEACDVTETEPVGPQCSAGPLLIEGNETYMLTAGHCFAKKVGEEGLVEVKVTSAYPEKEGPAQKEIGKSGQWKYLLAKDMAMVKVTRPGSFAQALPTPIPALMMEWGVKTETPSAVIGEAANMKGEANCRVGMTTGEKCGEILRVNVSSPSGFEHLVEDTACSGSGDSGGPFFFNGGKVNNVTMQGMLVRGEKECGEAGTKTWYEPLKDEGAVGFGILSNFPGKQLLTTANETRPVKLPDLSLLSGESFPVVAQASSTAATALETSGGSVLTGKGVETKLEWTTLASLGSYTARFKEVVKGTKKCETTGAGAGNVLVGGEVHLVFTSTSPLTVAALFLVPELTVECEGLNVKLKGSALGTFEGALNTDLTTFSDELKGSKGTPGMTAYFNDGGTIVTAELLSSVEGGTFKKSSQNVAEKQKFTVEASKMITVTG